MAAFQLRVWNYLFTPKLIPTLVTLALFPTLLALGFWQLDRADEKRQTDEGVKLAIAKMPLRLNDINLENVNRLIQDEFRPATIKGKFDNDNQFLLDNRTHLGKPGYHVLTPFVFINSGSRYVILVNRGWITYNGTRDNIPDISIDVRQQEILGKIKQVGDSIVLNDDGKIAKVASNPELIQSIELTELDQKLDDKLLPVIIELDKLDENGFVREWQPYYGSIDKHNAYALQWFAMAAILLFLFVRLNTKKN